MPKFANILHDEAFKVVMAEPSNEQLLIELVELLLPGKKIQSLSLDDKEQHGLILSDKNCTFDLYCTTDTNERLIVEMQFQQQTSYRDRMLYYATYPIRSQVIQRMRLLQKEREKDPANKPIKKMDYSLSPVYVIGILNFSLPHEQDDVLEEGLISRYDLRSARGGELMTDALHFVYLELERLPWKKDEHDKCRSLTEQLAYSLRYGHLLESRPDGFDNDLLKRLYDATEFANMNEKQLIDLNTIMTTQLDIEAFRYEAQQAGLKEGREKGLKEGREKGLKEGREKGLKEGRAEGRAEGAVLEKQETARKMLTKGYELAEIAEITGLSPEEIGLLGK